MLYHSQHYQLTHATSGDTRGESFAQGDDRSKEMPLHRRSACNNRSLTARPSGDDVRPTGALAAKLERVRREELSRKELASERKEKRQRTEARTAAKAAAEADRVSTAGPDPLSRRAGLAASGHDIRLADKQVAPSKPLTKQIDIDVDDDDFD